MKEFKQVLTYCAHRSAADRLHWQRRGHMAGAV